jgi:hypothetical protein
MRAVGLECCPRPASPSNWERRRVRGWIIAIPRPRRPPGSNFAKLVKYRFESWMTADEAVANRFRTYLKEHNGKDDGPQTLVVKAWLNPDGSVERVSFASLNDHQAD